MSSKSQITERDKLLYPLASEAIRQFLDAAWGEGKTRRLAEALFCHVMRKGKPLEDGHWKGDWRSVHLAGKLRDLLRAAGEDVTDDDSTAMHEAFAQVRNRFRKKRRVVLTQGLRTFEVALKMEQLDSEKPPTWDVRIEITGGDTLGVAYHGTYLRKHLYRAMEEVSFFELIIPFQELGPFSAAALASLGTPSVSSAQIRKIRQKVFPRLLAEELPTFFESYHYGELFVMLNKVFRLNAKPKHVVDHVFEVGFILDIDISGEIAPSQHQRFIAYQRLLATLTTLSLLEKIYAIRLFPEWAKRNFPFPPPPGRFDWHFEYDSALERFVGRILEQLDEQKKQLNSDEVSNMETFAFPLDEVKGKIREGFFPFHLAAPCEELERALTEFGRRVAEASTGDSPDDPFDPSE